jgi:hypothetical protein
MRSVLAATVASVVLRARTFTLERVELEPHKQAYFGRVHVGSPAQAFTMLFDTGSGNLILPSTRCPSAACQNHARYDMSASSSARDVQHSEDGGPVTLKFGTGSVDGELVSDRVCLGSICDTQEFVAATSESDQPFERYVFDGIFGLGLPEMSENPKASFLAGISASKALPSTAFGLFLADAGQSEITFGGPDPRRHSGDIAYFPVTGDDGYWAVQISGFAVDHAALPGNGHGCRAVLDSGTSQIAGPTALIVAIVEKIDVAKDCSNLATLPTISVLVGDAAYDLDPEDYVDNMDGECELALMPMDVPPPQGPLVVLGEPFLRKYYTVYDFDERRVGFATAAHNA